MLKLLVSQYINTNLADHNMTYKKLSAISQVPMTTIHAYAQGRTANPNEENLIRIAAAFGDGPEVIHEMRRASLDSTVKENMLVAKSTDKEMLEEYASLIRANVAQILEEYRVQSSAQQTEIIQHADRRVATVREETAKQCQLVAEQCRQHEHEYKQQCDALLAAERRAAAAEHAADTERVARLERTLFLYRIVSAVLFLFVLALVFFPLHARAEEFDWYSTRHFVYAVPSGWQGYESEAGFTFLGNLSDQMPSFLNVNEVDLGIEGSYEDYGDLLDDTLVSKFYGNSVNDLYKKELTGDLSGVLFVGNGSASGIPYDLATATITKSKYMLNFTLVCPQLSRGNVISLAERLADSLIYLPAPEQPAAAPSSSTDPLAFIYDIGSDVYKERFRGAKFVESSGYLFVDSDAGYADYQRVDMALLNAKDYLAQLRPHLDSGEFAFKEINFRTYLECVDNYGNVEDVKVLSFWLKMEDVLKMKFETIPLSGLRALSYDWYQHSVLK